MQEIQDMKEKIFKHVFMPFRPINWLREGENLRFLTKGEGIYVTDATGRVFIDGAAGWQFGAVGHGRTEIGDAIRDQIAKIAIAAPEFANVPCANLAEKLSEIAPGELTKVAFTNSGSEAVERALQMAKQYHVLNGEPRRHKVISRRGSYAGWTLGCMSVGGTHRDIFSYYEPLAPIAVRVFPPYCYRCDFGLTYPGCDLQCAREIERVIQFERPENVSAVLGEPVSHSNMVAVPPPEYWPMVRSICDKYGVLLINDEVITGFGRTGKWFACEHWDYTPDIITFAKSMTSGYIPMAGAITTSKIAEKIESAPKGHITSLPTWGGNPVSSAGALANIDIMEREKLVENSAQVGKYFLEGLKDKFANHPMIGDIRGLGLIIGLEAVADKDTKAQFDQETNFPYLAFKQLEREGLLSRDFESTILFTPPLCLSKADVDEIIQRLGRAIDGLAKDLRIM